MRAAAWLAGVAIVWAASGHAADGPAAGASPATGVCIFHPDEPVDLVADATVVASGELVVVDGCFGFRVLTTATQSLSDLDQPKEGGPSR